MTLIFYVAVFIKVTAAILIFHSMMSEAARKFHWSRRLPFAIGLSSLALSAAMQIASITNGPWSELLMSREILITTIGGVYIVGYFWPRRKDGS